MFLSMLLTFHPQRSIRNFLKDSTTFSGDFGLNHKQVKPDAESIDDYLYGVFDDKN